MAKHLRDYPWPVTGWITRGVTKNGSKIYRTSALSYYAIAKEIVLEKYPAWLTDPARGLADPMANLDGWCPEQWREPRREKALALFWQIDDGAAGEYFDTDRFRKFVQRVAKWLRYFDRKKFAATPHTRFDAYGTVTLQQLAAVAETNADFWINHFASVKAELARRAVGECLHPRRYTRGQCQNCGAMP